MFVRIWCCYGRLFVYLYLFIRVTYLSFLFFKGGGGDMAGGREGEGGLTEL